MPAIALFWQRVLLWWQLSHYNNARVPYSYLICRIMDVRGRSRGMADLRVTA
jgi:hypothetical protein